MTFDSINEGDAPEALTIGPISRTDIVRYQGASGDMNPVHHDEPFATGAGFEVPLGVGMYPAGVMHAWLGGWLGPENVRGCRTRWKSAYFPGESLNFSAKVVSKDAETRQLHVEAVCTKADGSVTMQGWMTFQF